MEEFHCSLRLGVYICDHIASFPGSCCLLYILQSNENWEHESQSGDEASSYVGSCVNRMVTSHYLSDGCRSLHWPRWIILEFWTPAIIGQLYMETKPRRYFVMPRKVDSTASNN